MNDIKYSEAARDKILDTIVDNFDYFREHPKQLAWAMMKFRLVHTASRIAYGACEDNPKYPVLDAGNLLKSEDDGNLLYDAWATSCSNYYEFPDVAREPLAAELVKSNKTMDDWIKIQTNPLYKYTSPDKEYVIDNLLCVIGTGYGWNKDGFITETGPSDVDENIFAGYTFAEPEVRRDIRSAINKLCNNKILKDPIADYMKKVEINWGNNDVEQTILNQGWLVGQTLRDKGKPELVKRAEKAYRFISYLEKLVNTACNWDSKQWAKARKKSTWTYKGRRINVSEVQPNFIYRAYGFDHELRCSKGSLDGDLRAVKSFGNARDAAWSDFVYATNDHPDVAKAQKVLRRGFGKNKASERALKKATTTLRKHQPNYHEHAELYKRAYKGDKSAVAKLNKIVKIPRSGWASVKFIVKYELKHRELMKDYYPKTEKTHYPLGTYANMVEMPDNAHPSYVSAGIQVAKEIIANKAEQVYSKKAAKKFLKKWDR